MKDFGGLVRSEDGVEGRSRRPMLVVVGVVSLAVVVAWFAQRKVDIKPDIPVEERIEEAAAKIQPSLDPQGDTAERYPGSPWERRNNMIMEIVDIVERGGDTYTLSEEVREYARTIKDAVDESCAEVLVLLSKNPVEWSGVISHAGTMREGLLRRFDQAIAPWPNEHRKSLLGVKTLFECR